MLTHQGRDPEQNSGQDTSLWQRTASHTSSPRSVSPNTSPIEESRPSQPDMRPEVARIRSRTTFTSSPPIMIPETQPLTGPYDGSRVSRGGIPRYGSIVGSPPERQNPAQMSSLELPDPAMSNPDKRSRNLQGLWSISAQAPSGSADAYHVGETHVPHKPLGMGLPKHMFQP